MKRTGKELKHYLSKYANKNRFNMVAQKRIDKGVAWLDKVRPGWEKEIDVETLEMSEMDSCILGQLFGNVRNVEFFLNENDHRFTDWDKLEEYGFVSKPHKGYDVLQTGWVNMIQERVKCQH